MARPLFAVAATVLVALLPALACRADAQSSPSDYTSAVRYDLARRVVGMIAPDPDGSGLLHFAAVRNTYDAAGNLIKVEKGELSSWQSENVAPKDWELYTIFTVFQTVTTTFDVMDRKVTEALSSAGTTYSLTQFNYDGVGRPLCTAVRMNPAVYGSLPDACTLGAAGSNGPDRITRMTYDGAGQVLKVQKAYGTPLQQDYATLTYSANGKQTSMTDANGNLAQMGYDGFDRQVRWTFPSPTTPGTASATDYEAYSYDANGNRLTLRKRDGRTLSYSYDALNRVSVKTVNGACVSGYACTTPPSWAVRNVYYGYDLRGLQTYARFDSASGEGVSNSYDGFGRLTSSTTAMGGVTRTLSSAYDADSNRTSLTHPDGVVFAYGYDGLDRMLTSDWYTPSQGSYTRYLSIAYDAQGRRGSTNRASSYSFYGYDGVSRLASLQQAFASGSANSTTTFGYNPASQIVSQGRDNTAYAFTGYVAASNSYAVNGLNQYTAVGAGSLGYDANGNLAATGGTSFTYDVENRLVTAVGTLNASLVYDPLGRLWQTSGGAYGTSQFLYDGDAMVAEYDGSTGALRRRFAFGPGVDEPVLWDEGGALDCSGTKVLHPDQQGSIVALAGCGGNPLAINSYDEYGVPSAGNVGRFQYTGQAYIPELGMYYYKARIYAARLGRFLQTDPIGYKDQNNLYAYVANDPVNATDPSGMLTGSLFDNVAPPGLSINGVDVQAAQMGAANAAPPGQNGSSSGAKNKTVTTFSIPDGSGKMHTVSAAKYAAWCAANRCRTIETDRVEIDGKPLYRNGPFRVRNRDVDVDPDTGLVRPTRGLSLNTDPGFARSFGPAREVNRIPPGLSVRFTGGTHYELVPSSPMSLERYTALVESLNK